MQKTIYVGNLQWDVTDDELSDFFTPVGAVFSAEVVREQDTGRSRGYGFVSMENADRAMTELNGKELRGRAVRISPRRSIR